MTWHKIVVQKNQINLRTTCWLHTHNDGTPICYLFINKWTSYLLILWGTVILRQIRGFMTWHARSNEEVWKTVLSDQSDNCVWCLITPILLLREGVWEYRLLRQTVTEASSWVTSSSSTACKQTRQRGHHCYCEYMFTVLGCLFPFGLFAWSHTGMLESVLTQEALGTVSWFTMCKQVKYTPTFMETEVHNDVTCYGMWKVLCSVSWI